METELVRFGIGGGLGLVSGALMYIAAENTLKASDSQGVAFAYLLQTFMAFLAMNITMNPLIRGISSGHLISLYGIPLLKSLLKK